MSLDRYILAQWDSYLWLKLLGQIQPRIMPSVLLAQAVLKAEETIRLSSKCTGLLLPSRDPHR